MIFDFEFQSDWNIFHEIFWICAYVDVDVCCIVQAADSSQEDEMMKISSTGVTEPEKSASTSTEGQKTEDDHKVTAFWTDFYSECSLVFIVLLKLIQLFG